MKREETVDYGVKSVWHAISRMYYNYGTPYEVTASTGFVLLNIDAEKGTPATKIAPMLGMESRSLTRMLKTMEEKGWVYRQKDPQDGRSVRICLTNLGREKREISRRAVKTFNKKVRSRVTSEEMDTFFKVLSHVNEVTEEPNLFKEVADSIAFEFKNSQLAIKE